MDTFTWDPTKLQIKLTEDNADLANGTNVFGNKSFVTFAPGSVIGNVLPFSLISSDVKQY